MSSLAICQPTLRVSFDSSSPLTGRVSVCGLAPDLIAFLASCAPTDDLLKSIFRVTAAQVSSPPGDSLPDVFGRHILLKDELQFIPHFPFERNLKYRVVFDTRPLSDSLKPQSAVFEFLVPTKRKPLATTKITNIFPSSNLLPENLLRFYVCFSNSMQRGRALDEVSLLDSDGNPVPDALYRSPVELWDRSMRRLTVLLDPGRLKRLLGPNVELGPPLKSGKKYTLQIGSRMTDLHGRSLRKSFQKDFLVGDPFRERIAIESWKILPPLAGSREALLLTFSSPLDWALLWQTITIKSADGLVIEGTVAIDDCERRWSFTPKSPWIPGAYRISVASGLEDICGNTLTAAFDRSLPKGRSAALEISRSSLIFQLA